MDPLPVLSLFLDLDLEVGRPRAPGLDLDLDLSPDLEIGRPRAPGLDVDLDLDLELDLDLAASNRSGTTLSPQIFEASQRKLGQNVPLVRSVVVAIQTEICIVSSSRAPNTIHNEGYCKRICCF
ncbi:uncharacterized protein [Dermacentor albipictus]|uniref:uncharacterized protein n=1 Tax=Dermacentor albipictus TaxID=60249 RepID=UPI0038FD14B4